MKKSKIFILLLAMALLLFLYIDDQISNFRVNRVELKTGKLDEEIRITQITDFHSNDRVDLNGVLKRKAL